jgi:hypothetical protein
MYIANEHTTRPEEFPITVVYKSVETGNIWCRTLDEWLTRVEPITN